MNQPKESKKIVKNMKNNTKIVESKNSTKKQTEKKQDKKNVTITNSKQLKKANIAKAKQSSGSNKKAPIANKTETKQKEK